MNVSKFEFNRLAAPLVAAKSVTPMKIAAVTSGVKNAKGSAAVLWTSAQKPASEISKGICVQALVNLCAYRNYCKIFVSTLSANTRCVVWF